MKPFGGYLRSKSLYNWAVLAGSMAKNVSPVKVKDEKKDIKGLTATKDEDFSEWFTQLIQKAELIEYSPVSGCYILRPNAYAIWEKVQAFFDGLIKIRE